MAKTFEALEKSKKRSYLKKKGKVISLWETPLEVRHQFEMLKSQIILKGKNEQIQTILFTSYSHGEGTTTIVSNFAESLIQDQRYKVLVVDANTRTPGLHHLQAIDKNSVKLVFQDLYKDENRKLDFPKPNPSSNVAILSCDLVSAHPSQIFNHQKFDDFITQAKKNFDFIIFDSSPIGKYYDSLVLATHIDGVVLITQAEKSTNFEISRAKDLLEKRNIPIIGLILNRRKFRIPAAIYNRFFK